MNWTLARKFAESRRLLNEGAIYESQKNPGETYKKYLAAYQANPEDVRAIKALFMFLRATGRLDLLPPELEFLKKPSRGVPFK